MNNTYDNNNVTFEVREEEQEEHFEEGAGNIGNDINACDKNAISENDQSENGQLYVPTSTDEVQSELNFNDIRKGDKLLFTPSDSNEEICGTAISRGGKRGGHYDAWWNIDPGTGEESRCWDTSEFQMLRRAPDGDNAVHTEEVFVVQIPRYLHNDKKCVAAKEKELASWDEFQVYEEVIDIGQERLDTNWILIEKVIEDELDVKARLCVRGDQEEASFRTDSPTVHKDSINIFFMLAAKNNWTIQTADIKCAFLQGKDLEREVFVRPPKERRIPGILWKMLKGTYGFTDASRGFYLELLNTLRDSGCTPSKFDPATYLYYKEGQLQGICLTHVDDLIHGSGTSMFYQDVMMKLKEKFKFGSEETSEFRYVGMNVKQHDECIVVNQDHYINSMEFPQEKRKKDDNLLDVEEKSEFRRLLGRIGWLGNQSRPDLVFDYICLSTKLGKATYNDFSEALKVVRKMVATSTKIKFPALGDVTKWVVDAYADAGFKSLPDQVSSCGGQVVFIRDIETNKTCTISWKGRKLRRIVTSSTAAETLALNEVLSEIIFVKALLSEMVGSEADGIPVNLYTDSKNVIKSVNSTSMVDDPRLRTEIACLKESLEKGEVTSLIHVLSASMLANCMTKKGASAKSLMQVMHDGYLKP